jgi:MFS family permease
VSNTALSGYLAMSAAGVLAGGVLAARTNRHDRVAIASLVVFAAITLLIAFVELPALALVSLIGIAGLSNGVIMPARDLLVRAITPPGAFGKVFGFVTSGFNIGGIVSPLLFGWLLDHGNPRGVFIAAALLSLICIPTVTLTVARMRAR